MVFKCSGCCRYNDCWVLLFQSGLSQLLPCSLDSSLRSTLQQWSLNSLTMQLMNSNCRWSSLLRAFPGQCFKIDFSTARNGHDHNVWWPDHVGISAHSLIMYAMKALDDFWMAFCVCFSPVPEVTSLARGPVRIRRRVRLRRTHLVIHRKTISSHFAASFTYTFKFIGWMMSKIAMYCFTMALSSHGVAWLNPNMKHCD